MDKSLEGFESIKNELLRIVFDFEDLRNRFSRNHYEKEFYDLQRASLSTLDAYHAMWSKEGDPTALVKSIAEAFPAEAEERTKDLSRSKRETKIFDYNLILVAFFFPMLLEYQQKSTEELATKIRDCWNETFKKQQIQMTTFREIKDGFKTKYCYITTAVCTSLGKGDDCEELNILRDYRDGYLMSLENGEQMIDSYYDKAPTIVKAIDQRADRESIYKEIYQSYIMPCLAMIGRGDETGCLEHYKKMVGDLAKTYLYSNR